MKKLIYNIPNLISGVRIALVPVFIAVYLLEKTEIKITAIIIYAAAGVSDFLDGYIARKFKLTTKLGKVLDPLGDKLMMVSALVMITVDRIIPFWAAAAVIIKEAMMGIGGLIISRRNNKDIPPSNIIGKISTVLFIAACLTLMLLRGILSMTVRTVIIVIPVAFMLVAFGTYVNTYITFMNRGRAENLALARAETAAQAAEPRDR
ncbi:MAG: CDP-alcohol phosphatidyltransferase family protein [Oscillospiraceae bacterium]|jgi:CDP-diacylglycerol--glycerol-3-phosphate 3-phosphatidyltransferase|nr:CDP-alcohol phosphatidyltransferase family protein [Oscillospiraceae bacterium]